MLGHSMGILCLYEILRKVRKHLGSLRHALSAYVVNLWDSDSVDIHSDRLAPDLRSTTILSARIIHMRTCTGGARPPVARVHAPAWLRH